MCEPNSVYTIYQLWTRNLIWNGASWTRGV